MILSSAFTKNIFWLKKGWEKVLKKAEKKQPRVVYSWFAHLDSSLIYY